MFIVWHVGKWQKMGELAFSVPSSTGEKTSLGFNVIEIPPRTTLTASKNLKALKDFSSIEEPQKREILRIDFPEGHTTLF